MVSRSTDSFRSAAGEPQLPTTSAGVFLVCWNFSDATENNSWTLAGNGEMRGFSSYSSIAQCPGLTSTSTKKRLLALEPRRFELFVKDLLVSTGFEQVEVTRFSQDGGIDVNARVGAAVWAIPNLLVQVQAKRWLHTVGRKEVAELRGSLQPHAAGCIVTTSQFSRAALIESREPGKVPITVINGLELAGLTHAASMTLD